MTNYKVPRPSDESFSSMDAITTLWDEVDIYNGPQKLAQCLEGTTPGQRAVHACAWYEAEVNNGGHDQFFSNSTGILWPEALEGLELLGATRYLAILKKALAVFGPTPPSRDRADRNDKLEVLSNGFEEDLFDELDSEFYALEAEEPLEDIFRAFIRAHPEHFFL